MAISAHDIRMKEFKRAYLRGYSAEDVDTFLMHVAVEVDRRERQERAHVMNGAVAPAATPEPVQPVAAHPAPSPESTTALHAAPSERGTDEAEAIADQIIADAKATAERGLRRARERAEEMILEAREQQDRAARAEAEVQLQMAQLERRIGERAAALAAEARRLDELVGWLSENDLAPDQSEWHQPSHAAPSEGEVVPLARSAET